MSVLGQRLHAVHDGLVAARLPHAFGGAIALAYCIEEPRGTRDLDVNVFIRPDRATVAIDAMPERVSVTPAKRAAAERDGQVRLWWEDTPIDLFFDTHDFYEEVSRETRRVSFEGRAIPVLGCVALLVFKVMYGRPKDWGDIQSMLDAGVDGELALEHAKELLGLRDPSVKRLARTIAG